MINESELNKQLDTARETQRKFEFYFVALSFTSLGFAVQTARVEQHPLAVIAELAAWICLGGAGLSGLLLLEWRPGLHQYAAFQYETAQQLLAQRRLRDELRSSGTAPSAIVGQLDTDIAKLEGYVTGWKEKVASREAIELRKYRLMKFGYLAGVALLAISRAVEMIRASSA